MMKKTLLFIQSMLVASCLFAQTQNVTFQVSSPDSTPVFLFGSWNSFGNWPGTPMSDLGGGTWSVTIPIASNTTHEFLYVNGSGAFAKEILDPNWPCTNGNTQYTNRVLNLGTNDTALCYTWNTCNACVIVPPPASVTVMFQVQNPDSLPVYVFGSWTNWGNFPGDIMTDANGDNIWDVSLSLPANAAYEFLYVNGNAPITEDLNPAWTCTNGNGQYTNRVLNVGSNNLSICNRWALCDTCGSVVIPNVDVTFIVENPDSTPVYLFGSWNGFNNWPGTPMTLNTNGTWQTQLPLPENSTVEYLYVNGNGPAKEILDPQWPCTNGNSQYTNRVLNIGNTNLITCSMWQSCSNCSMVSLNEISNNNYFISINNSSMYIHSSTNFKIDDIEIFDIVGQRVFHASGNANCNTNIPVNLQNNNMYVIRIKSGNTFYTTKQICINR